MNKEWLINYLDFLWAMTEKEIKARYKHTLFGFLWVVLNPLFQMIVIGFVFSFFVKVEVENYYLFLFSGLLPWQFFSLSLTKTTPAFVYERSLLQKANFPKEVIPFAIILSNFFHFLVAYIFFIIFLIFTGSLVFPRILLIIPASFLLLVFTVGTSLFASTLQVKFRDIAFFVQSLVLIWFYATPIVYTFSLLPDFTRVFFFFNPLTSTIMLFQSSVFSQIEFNFVLFLVNQFIMAIVFIIAAWLFRKEHRNFVDWL
jgi:ABC-2 type transport system permease protein